RLVPDMTTLDNVAARIDHLPDRAQHSLALARAQLAAFALEGYAARLVREIGLGFHKLIELARASGGEPALLLLDEPAVGLTSDEVVRLAAALKRLRAEGAAILVVEHSIDYGRLTVFRDARLRLEAGQTIGLLGANGAGKTTLMKTIAGALVATAGRVLLGEQDVTQMKAFERARAGLALVPEGRHILSTLT